MLSLLSSISDVCLKQHPISLSSNDTRDRREDQGDFNGNSRDVATPFATFCEFDPCATQSSQTYL